MVNMPQKTQEYEFNSVEEALADFGKLVMRCFVFFVTESTEWRYLIAENKFVIVMDNEDRENEGDLIVAGKGVTTEQMAFLIKYSRCVFLYQRELSGCILIRCLLVDIFAYQ